MVEFLAKSGTMLNYGCDKLRFMNPVHSGKKIRFTATLSDVIEKGPGYLLRQDIVVDVEGDYKPAVICEWLTMYIVD
jgi:acyl dehydratase